MFRSLTEITEKADDLKCSVKERLKRIEVLCGNSDVLPTLNHGEGSFTRVLDKNFI